MFSKIPEYWKGVIASLGAIAYAVQAAVTDGNISDQEKVTIGLAVLVALGVIFKRNQAPAA